MMPSFIWKHHVRVPLLRLSSRCHHLSALLLHPTKPIQPLTLSKLEPAPGQWYANHCPWFAPPTQWAPMYKVRESSVLLPTDRLIHCHPVTLAHARLQRSIISSLSV